MIWFFIWLWVTAVALFGDREYRGMAWFISIGLVVGAFFKG